MGGSRLSNQGRLLLIGGLLLTLGIVWLSPPHAPALLNYPQELVHSSASVELVWDRSIPLRAQAITVSPHTQFQTEWSPDGRRLTVWPQTRWSWQTTYTLELASGQQCQFTTQPEPKVSLFAAGDVMLDKKPGELILQQGPGSVFTGVDELMLAADLAFVNLEGPVSEGGGPVSKRYTFCGQPTALEALVEAGIDVVSFANNHALDYGVPAFLDTLQYLGASEIAYVGAGRNRLEALSPWLTEVNGLTIGFLAFGQRDVLPGWAQTAWAATDEGPGIAMHDVPGGREEMLAAIKQTKQLADVVLVSMHWGYEGLLAPVAWQRELGRAIIDAGATAIIGHHPHQAYGVELYDGKPIFYSLGNFLFHPYEDGQREGYVALLELGLSGVKSFELIPILMEGGTTAIFNGAAAGRMLDIVHNRSLQLGVELAREGERLVWGGD